MLKDNVVVQLDRERERESQHEKTQRENEEKCFVFFQNTKHKH